MLAFLIRRSVLAVFTIFSISIFSFMIIQLPAGDYVDSYILRQIEEGFGGVQRSSAAGLLERKEALRKLYGLDRPMYIQYFKWIGRAVQGRFGQALEYRLPIWEVIKDRLFLTIILAGATIVFTWVLAIPIGIYTAVKQRSVADYSFTFAGFLGLAHARFPCWPLS